MSESASAAFHDFLASRIEAGALSSDEVLAAVLPLFQQVSQVHQAGRVAPLAGLAKLKVSAGRCWFSDSDAVAPKLNSSALSRIEKIESRAVEVVGKQEIRDGKDGGLVVTDKIVGKRGEAITRPVYLPGYIAWEHEVEHHDQLTDIFSLGLVLASLACGVDLSDEEELARFAESRANLFQLNPHLHPVLAKAIVRMTDLQRRTRAQDLPSLISVLTHYRLQALGPDLDFQRIKGFREANHRGRAQLIQERLRDRLFEISRRNRLLYFKPTMQMLNLTVASVPVMLDYQNISPESLCTWQGEFERAISHGETVQLGRYLRFEDAPYITGALDQIRNQEARDRNEYGFSQLRLVLAYLRWHNLKELKEERITSPLVLLPVALERKKGIRDSYTITPTSTEAEVNPVLRHHLKQVYGLQLPEFIDLSQTTLKAFFELLGQQIQKSEPGITLRLIEKPQIKLVHERARARLEQYRRRNRLTGRGVRVMDGIDYSYSREQFHPLGLQLFLRKVKPSASPFDTLVGEEPRPRAMNVAPAPEPESADPSVREREMYVLQQGNETNPYLWDFDLCSLTLGNFNYRKMSLVRDYTSLLEGNLTNGAFDEAFSLQPRKAEPAPPEPLAPEESFQIVASDPTQMAAITRARSGASFIIQGPPGTGKSQTITNLIADYVARGKRVLFVCEKRAAIDVVYYRLKQRGLDKLCCLIHDSQADKKAFIQDLKGTYEQYLAAPDALKDAEDARDTELKHLRQELDALDRFCQAMKHVDERDGIALRQIYERLHELTQHAPEVSEALSERLPRYADWRRHGDDVRTLGRILQEIAREPVFAKQSLRLLARPMITAERPIETITSALDRTDTALTKLSEQLKSGGNASAVAIAELRALIEYAQKVNELAQRGLLDLLDSQNARNEKLGAAVRQKQKLAAKLQAAAEKTTHWKKKISAADLPAVIDSAQAVEGSILRFLMPSFWRLRRILNEHYDFKAHVVAPAWSRILADLLAQYSAEDALTETDTEYTETYKVEDIGWLHELVKSLHANESSLSPSQSELRHQLLAKTSNAQTLTALVASKNQLDALLKELDALIDGHENRSLAQTADDLSALRQALPLLPDLLPVLGALSSAPREFYRMLCEQPWSADQHEAGVLLASLNSAYRRDRSLTRMDGRVLAQHVERLKTHYQQLMALNARVVVQRVHHRFAEKVSLSALPAAQLTSEQKEWKKAYSKGRRELEHEFSKVMRYRSIRDLSDDETGLVVADLKPIWLMSPLSVSDTLPLANTNFDVVIFDEASQIPLEEAVPALYRAPQIIVVGDEMQLPPTNFFSSKGEEEESLVIEEQGENISYELSSDSFLTQAAGNLPSTMLGWHYRSRSESLISFSNAAFYSRKLLTIPDVSIPSATSAIDATPASGDANVAHVFDRPVSFHYLKSGVYTDRRNPSEAAYISRLLRGLLKLKSGKTIGIVAFSEAQQGEIESALNALAADDAEFKELLEAEFQREEDDQFCGLFVKNLENVQGDERDIIILSVCYGYDSNGKMLMNFGPINKNGGEKRLNVVFSRARHHMVLVSSIKHTAITNEYNDGANCLRRYLAYAEALSSGQFDTARRVLHTFGTGGKADEFSADVIARSIASSLKERGYAVDLGVGESHFRCDLAVRKQGDAKYRLGVLLDKIESSRHGVLERWLLQPSVLQGFGWKVVRVTAKDWHHDPTAVLATLERELS